MVTDTFFRVLFPQCEQNTRLMSDVVLETEKEGLCTEAMEGKPRCRAQGELWVSEEKDVTRKGGRLNGPRCITDYGCLTSCH